MEFNVQVIIEKAQALTDAFEIVLGPKINWEKISVRCEIVPKFGMYYDVAEKYDGIDWSLARPSSGVKIQFCIKVMFDEIPATCELTLDSLLECKTDDDLIKKVRHVCDTWLDGIRVTYPGAQLDKY